MTKTRMSIIRRMNGLVPGRTVPKFVQDVIDHVIDLFREECFDTFPRSANSDVEETRYWSRLDFYKKKVMSAFMREYHTDDLDKLLRGRSIPTGTAAIWFHQYVAAIKRACDSQYVEADCPLSIDVGDVQTAAMRLKNGQVVFN